MDAKVIERIHAELDRIDKKENKIYFFVIDTKGNPSGSLEYIYKMAFTIKEDGFDVTMLYQTVGKDDEFVGVADWLDEKYSNLPHMSVSSEEINVSPSDILFIPEIFSNVMIQTKKLPCKRIAILQNYDYMVEQMPFSVQWGDLGIMECVTNTEYNANLLKESFPYVKTTVVEPYIDEMFGTTSEPKKMIVNIVSKDQSDINRLIKPFYWKFPAYKWVSFRDLRGMNKKDFATALREAEVTICIDDNSSFGYSALEAMKSGNIVLMKTTINEMPWARTDGEYNDSCIWFNDFNDCHKMLASIIRSIITNKVPNKIKDSANIVINEYTKEKFEKDFTKYIYDVIGRRRNDISDLLTQNTDNGE